MESQYTHIGKTFPETEDTYIHYLDLNQSNTKFSCMCPHRAIYLSNSKYRSWCGSYESPWIRKLIEIDKECQEKFGTYDKPDYNKYIVTLKQDAKIFNIRCVGDVHDLKNKYSYIEMDDINDINEIESQNKLLEEIDSQIYEEMQRIMNEAEDTQDDVYFNCSKTQIVKLYDRKIKEIVFAPQQLTITRKSDTKTKSMKIPKIWELDLKIKQKIKDLDSINKNKKISLCIDYNKMRREGYHGIEIHSEFSDWIYKHSNTNIDTKTGKSYRYFHRNDNIMHFFGWLSFPQLIVLNWCFDKIEKHPFNLDDHKI
jgi:hypothetical protein